MSQPHDVALTKEQLTQLAKDAAICAKAIVTLSTTAEAIASAKRILKVLHLE